MVSFIDFPVFNGVSGDLWQWILWLEDFFVRERFTADEKMNLAQSLLEGKAYAWFSRNQKIFNIQSWEELRDMLWLMFGDFEDSISSMATIKETITVEKYANQQKIVEDSSENVTESLEEQSITPIQVPVSNPEHSLQIPKESLSVCANSQAMVGCEHQRSIQQNMRMYVVTGDVERIQPVMSITNNVSAHQVFDKTSPHKDRLKPKTKRKLSLSLKTWMFKFKSTSKRRKSLDVKSFSVQEIAWLMRDSKEIYRSCVDKEFNEVVAGCGKKLFDRFQTSPSYALDVVNKTSKPWETHTPFTSTHVASVNSLSLEVGTSGNFKLGVGHDKGIMGLKLLLHSDFEGEKLTTLDVYLSKNHGLLVFPWNLMLLEFFLFFHLEDKVCLSGASNSWCGWLVFDRGKNHIISGDVITRVFLDLKKCFFHGAEKRDVQTRLLVKAKVAHEDSLIVRIKVILCYGVALGKEIQGAEIQGLSLYTELWNKNRLQEINLTDTKFLCDKVNRVSCLSLAAQFKSLEIIQAGLQQILQGDDEASTKIIDKLQKSLSIWHRWRRKD